MHISQNWFIYIRIWSSYESFYLEGDIKINRTVSAIVKFRNKRRHSQASFYLALSWGRCPRPRWRRRRWRQAGCSAPLAPPQRTCPWGRGYLVQQCKQSSVVDLDMYIFEPPRSGSVNILYGCGSTSKKCKENLHFYYILWLLCSLWKLMSTYLRKVINFLVPYLVSHWQEKDPDPNP